MYTRFHLINFSYKYLITLAVLIIYKSLVWIKRGEHALLFKLGSFERQLKPGINFIPPFVGSIVKISANQQILLVNLSSSKLDLADSKVKVIFKVTNPQKAILQHKDFIESLRQIVLDLVKKQTQKADFECQKSQKKFLHKLTIESDFLGLKIIDLIFVNNKHTNSDFYRKTS